MKQKIAITFIALTVIVLGWSCVMVVSAYAGEQGHYSSMPIGVRDMVMPPKGFYLVSYDMYYGSNTFKDRDGKKFDAISSVSTITKDISVLGTSVPVTITGNLNADLNINFDAFFQMIPLIWAPGIKILGADYAFFIMPMWGYSRVDVKAVANATGTIAVGGRSKTLIANKTVEIMDQNTGFADLYVQPLWLDWRWKHYDLGISYGVWCPTGYYDKDNITNIGMGFLTQQVQANACFYPFENKTTAFMVRPTYEWNSKKIDEHVQPGQVVTLEYGISHFIHPRVELGMMGYNVWQISEDHGSAATNKGVMDRVNGFGAQLTCWVVENKCSITGKYNQEYLARDRFEGTAWSINVLWIF